MGHDPRSPALHDRPRDAGRVRGLDGVPRGVRPWWSQPTRCCGWSTTTSCGGFARDVLVAVDAVEVEHQLRELAAREDADPRDGERDRPSRAAWPASLGDGPRDGAARAAGGGVVRADAHAGVRTTALAAGPGRRRAADADRRRRSAIGSWPTSWSSPERRAAREDIQETDDIGHSGPADRRLTLSTSSAAARTGSRRARRSCS